MEASDKLLIYNYASDVNTSDTKDQFLSGAYRMQFWRPSWRNLIPPGKDKKYLLYWLYHQLGIFYNTEYSAVFLYDRETLVCSMLIVPSHYKWPFMNRDDIQFTYVMTNPEYRGKGIAGRVLMDAINTLKADGRKFWYVTDPANSSSVQLCEKANFKFFGSGVPVGFFKVLKLSNS